MSAASLASSDPTGTTTKRQEWIRDFNRRWRRVRGRVRDELRNNARLHPDADRSTGRQTREFRDFLERVIDEEVVEPMPLGGVINGNHYTGPRVREAFLGGIVLGNAYLRREGFDADPVSYNRAEQLLQYDQYRSPLEDRYEFAYDDLVDIGQEAHTHASRNYREQVGATGAVGTLLTGPNQTTDGIQNRLDKRGQTGTQRLAESHTVMAANLGALYHYQDNDVQEVGAVVELSTDVSSEEGEYRWTDAGDERVCAQCRILNNNTYSVTAVLSGDAPMPVRDSHVGCRCFLAPTK